MVKEVASSVVEGLKTQPIALSLIVVNVLYLAAGYWFLSVINERGKTRDAMITQLVMRECK